jgi:hypothetical protein
MVTESDLLRRLALSDEPQHGWLRSLFDDHDRAAALVPTVRPHRT